MIPSFDNLDNYTKEQLSQIENNDLLNSIPIRELTIKRNEGLSDNRIVIMLKEIQQQDIQENSKAYLLKAKEILELKTKLYSNMVIAVEGKRDDLDKEIIKPIGSGFIIPAHTETYKGKQIRIQAREQQSNNIMYAVKVSTKKDIEA